MTNNKDKKVLNVPNLRFPEFTDKWEAGKLEEYILLVSGQDLSSEQYTDKEDVYPYITGASSLNSEGIILNRWTHTPTQIVKRGDILLVCKGSGVGQLTVLSNVDKAHIARQIMGIRAKNTESQLFIYHYLSRLMTELKKRSTGIIPGIDRKSILSLHISIPSLQEQQKVAELLSLIEQRIITQNKIIEDLKKLKSAISERFFTSINGDVVTLADICDIVKGKQVNGEFLTDSGNYYVMNGGIEPSGYYDDYNTEANTISISEGGNSCGYVQFNTTPFWSGGHCYTIQNITNNVEKLYLYHYLKCNEDTIMKLRIGSGLPNIQKKDLAKFRVIVPIIEQQKTISAFLSLLERKVQVETDILIAVQSEKQYLLRQMFI